MFTDLLTDTAPKQIATQIKDAILEGKLSPQERLPTEEELAAQFSVSRATVREALKRLASENLVESRRGASGGTFIKVPSNKDICQSIETALQVAAALGGFTFEEVIESRLHLGSLSCRLAAPNRTAEDLEALKKEVEIQADSGTDDVQFCESDVRFHGLLAKASNNNLLSACITGIAQGLQPATNFMLVRFRDRKVITLHHREIVACLEAQDADGAIRIIEQQIQYLRETHSDAKAARTQKAKARKI